MKPLHWLVVFASVLTLPVHAAPLIDFSLKVGQWQTDYSGDIGENANTATLEELGFDDEDQSVITFELKHPIPVLPNLKLQHTDLDTEANGTLVRDLTVGDQTFTGDVTTNLDLSHTDVTLFYSPLNNWVKLDLGLTARYFGGSVDVESTLLEDENIDLDYWIPLAYLSVQLELPLTGLYLGANVNTVSYDDNSLTDLTAAVGYIFDTPGVGLVAELGYRTFELDIDDIDDFEGDIEIDGLYFQLGLAF